MRYIVFTATEKAALISYTRVDIKTMKNKKDKLYKDWEERVEEIREDFRCAEIKNDLCILPLAVTENKEFKSVDKFVNDNNITIREVLQTEFIEYNYDTI